MSDRRSQPYPPSANVALASQWTSSSPHYSSAYASQDHYSSSYGTHPSSLRHSSHSSPSVPSSYDNMSTHAQAIAAQYQLGTGGGAGGLARL